MELSKIWGWIGLSSRETLLAENNKLHGMIAETLEEVESTQEILSDFIDRLDSILDAVKKTSSDIK